MLGAILFYTWHLVFKDRLRKKEDKKEANKNIQFSYVFHTLEMTVLFGKGLSTEVHFQLCCSSEEEMTYNVH